MKMKEWKSKNENEKKTTKQNMLKHSFCFYKARQKSLYRFTTYKFFVLHYYPMAGCSHVFLFLSLGLIVIKMCKDGSGEVNECKCNKSTDRAFSTVEWVYGETLSSW